jgi:PAS domain S-box-containing protein
MLTHHAGEHRQQPTLQQVQTQEALRLSEDRFRKLTELSSDWYWEQDAKFCFVEMSGDASARSGLSVALYLGRRLWDLPALNLAATDWAAHRAVVAAGLPFHDFELRLPDRQGRAHWISISGLPIFNAMNNLTGYQGVGRDISADKQAKEVQQEALSRLQKMASRLPGMVYQYRLRMDGSACFPYASDAIKDIYRLTPDDVRESSAPALAVVHPDDRDGLRMSVRQSAQDLTPWQYEKRVLFPDGTVRWIQGNAIPEREPGGSTLWNGFMSDVTERKLAEQALQSSLAEKHALLNEVHHRVKNNLQVITSLLRLEAGRSTQPDTKTVLGDMQGRIRSMALLHESLYRSGVFASVDLGAYLRNLATQAFRSIAPQGGKVALKLDLMSVQVSMDQATPCGLLVNELISNCFKHGFPDGHGGEVHVALQSVGTNPQVCLHISDTGVGLPEDFGTRREQSLGLKLVSDLARQLGGQLTMGPGTLFEVCFTPTPTTREPKGNE